MEKLQQYLKDRGYSEIKVDGIIGNQTLKALQNYVEKKIAENKFKLPKKGIVWIRTDEKLTNTAGKYYIQNPITTGGITGTAVTTSPQQVLGSHQFVTSATWKSLWLGAPFFRQIKNLEIYRDGNKDAVIDKHTITKGLYGINFHRGGLGSLIDNWSAGCHVTKDAIWFDVQKLFLNNEIIDYTIIS